MTAETRSVYATIIDARSATYVRSTVRAARSAAYVQSTEQGRANRLAGLGIGVTGWCVGFIPHSWLCHRARLSPTSTKSAPEARQKKYPEKTDDYDGRLV